MAAPADTLARPSAVGRGDAVQHPTRRPRALVGIVVALWVALLGLAVLVCLTLAAWVTAARHDDAIRPALANAVQIWLVAHHTGLGLAGGSFGIVPLGLTAALAVVLVRGGRQAARLSGAHDLLDCVTTALAVAVPYGVIAALLTNPAQVPHVRPVPLQALSGAFVLALICTGLGALRETGQLERVRGAVPVGVRTVSRAGFGAAAVVVAIGAASVMIALASSAQRAGLLAQSVHGGLPGLLLMAVISIAYLPNAVIWACAYAVGPGFAVGAKTSVSLLGSHLGAVPALPLLAALPDDGKPAPLAWLAFSGPLAAGIFAGWLLARALPFSAASGSSPWWVRYRVAAIGWGLAAGALAGLTLGVLASLSGGPLGPGRMATVGPSPWRVGVAAAVEVGLLAAATLCLLAWRSADRDRAITI